MVLKYKIVTEEHASALVTAINQLISEGWAPQGGVAVATDANSKETTYAQAMLKED